MEKMYAMWPEGRKFVVARLLNEQVEVLDVYDTQYAAAVAIRRDMGLAKGRKSPRGDRAAMRAIRTRLWRAKRAAYIEMREKIALAMREAMAARREARRNYAAGQ